MRKQGAKLTRCLTLVIIGLIIIPLGAIAGEITLAWDPNSEADLAGYRLYIQEGPQASNYHFLVDIPLTDIDPETPSFTVFDLMEDTQYFFAITAYNDNGDESGLSNSVCVINEEQCAVAISVSNSGGCFIDTLNTPFAWRTPAPAH
jgi:chitinase